MLPYDYNKYGLLEGEVTQIGPDATEPDAQQSKGQSRGQQAQPSFYKAIVSLDSQVLGEGGKKQKLLSGMQVVAEINQGSRTVMRYLLSPVSKTLVESGRER